MRCYGVFSLRELQAQVLAGAGTPSPAQETFKDDEPGFVHMDIKYLSPMPDEQLKRYLFVALDTYAACCSSHWRSCASAGQAGRVLGMVNQ